MVPTPYDCHRSRSKDADYDCLLGGLVDSATVYNECQILPSAVDRLLICAFSFHITLNAETNPTAKWSHKPHKVKGREKKNFKKRAFLSQTA